MPEQTAENQRVQTSIRLDADLHEALKVQAAAERRRPNALIEDAIRAYLAQRG